MTTRTTTATGAAQRPAAVVHPLAGSARLAPAERVREVRRPATMSLVPPAGPRAVLAPPAVDRRPPQGARPGGDGPGGEDTVMHPATEADPVGRRRTVRTSVTGAVGERGRPGSVPTVHPAAARAPGLLGERMP